MVFCKEDQRDRRAMYGHIQGDYIVIMFDIAEWVANVLVLGLGMFFWALTIAVTFLIIFELKEKIDE